MRKDVGQNDWLDKFNEGKDKLTSTAEFTGLSVASVAMTKLHNRKLKVYDFQGTC